jgi:UDP-N-acetylmuramoyl-L-alanyl-D-glutamate--2,6-diaminopimelate ligase
LLPKGLRPVVPGRAERVADRPRAVVDIAHNPTRLGRVLESLRTTTKGRLTVVVGARPGDSPEVRREIGRAAGLADTVVVTDDDFGTGDDAAAIRADVVAGVREAGRAQVAEVSPRRAAIRGTVALADRDDTVLVAGRGHLTRLLVAGEREHLDDREEVRAGLAQRDGHASAG